MSKYQTKDIFKFLKPFSDEKKILFSGYGNLFGTFTPRPTNLFTIITTPSHLDGRQQINWGIPFVPSPLAGQARTSTLVFIGDRC